MSVKLGSTTKEVIDQINTNEKNKYEAYLNWGGKHLVGKYSPIDANLNMYLSPNRLAGMNVAGITIEYSNDGGSTWVDYGASDALKGGLVTSSGTIKIGGSSKTAGSVTANDMLRVTLDGVDGGVYTAINKVHIWVTTNGSQNCTVSLESYDYNSSTEWHSVISNQSITGWSAWNVLNFTLPGSGAFGGTNNARHQRKIRFTFKHSGCSSSYTGLNISRLYAYGGMGWSAPSNMALFGTPYSYDYASNVSFPANLNAKSISEGGALLSNKYLGISAKASDSAKLNGQEASYYLNYNNFTNKPTLSSFGITATATELNVLDGITATTTELNYTDGVTSNIQTQLNGKQASLSTTQLNAVNSGITSSKVSTYDGYASTLNGKLSLSGGTMTGNLKWSSSTALPEITSPKYFLSIDSFADGGTTKWVTLANAKSALGVPTNYAGSSSAGGSATSAVKLDSSAVGSATQPVYFSGGKPVATTYTLGASVPSNAKFTDTTYDVATASANGLMSSADKSKLDGIASGANKTTVDSAMSSTSTNPVQNKVVNSAISAKYTKPSTGIPKSDLASDVQTSLGKADSALQSHQSLANYVTLDSAQDITGTKTFNTLKATTANITTANVNQYNDASGVSLMNNGGGVATQFGSSSRPARMFSSTQPEWYKNGTSQGVLALKSDIPDNIPDTSNFVDLTSNQDISGYKQFNSIAAHCAEIWYDSSDLEDGTAQSPFVFNVTDDWGTNSPILGVRYDKGNGEDTATVVIGGGQASTPLEVGGSTGTAGQVLTSQGAGSTPEWGDLNRHNQRELTDKDLNTLVYKVQVGWYYAEAGNTCTNLPDDLSSGTGFGLEVGFISGAGSATPYVYQKLIPRKSGRIISCDVYYRSRGQVVSGSMIGVKWSSWVKLANDSDVPKNIYDWGDRSAAKGNIFVGGTKGDDGLPTSHIDFQTTDDSADYKTLLAKDDGLYYDGKLLGGGGSGTSSDLVQIRVSSTRKTYLNSTNLSESHKYVYNINCTIVSGVENLQVGDEFQLCAPCINKENASGRRRYRYRSMGYIHIITQEDLDNLSTTNVNQKTIKIDVEYCNTDENNELFIEKDLMRSYTNDFSHRAPLIVRVQRYVQVPETTLKQGETISNHCPIIVKAPSNKYSINDFEMRPMN